MTKYKYSTQSVEKILEEKGYGLLEGEEYKSIKEKLNIIDLEGYKYSISLDLFFIKENNFHRFFTGNIFTTENIKLWLIKNNKNFSFVSGEYTGARDKNLKFICHNCGNVWNTSWNDASNDHGCPICVLKNRSINRKIKIDKVLKLFQDNNISIIDIDEYIDTETKIYCLCNKCNYKWYTDYRHVKSEKGCPKCSSSHGEKRIQKFLDNKNISYEIQKRFKECIYKKHLPFDFYLSEYNVCIEYHGIQHYEKIDHFGGQEKFDKSKIRDDIKRNFCKENNVKLLEISYLDFDNIEEIMCNFLNFELD